MHDQERDNSSSPAGRVSRDAAQLLVRNIGLAAARNVPLSDVLEALSDDAGDRRLAEVAHRLAERIRAGATLEEVLTHERAAFPPQIRGILAAGVKANNLPLVLQGYAQIDLSRRHIRSTLRAALAYPIMIALLLIPLLLLIALYIAPMFEALFAEFDLELPEATLVAFRTARAMPLVMAAALVVPAFAAGVLSVLGAHWLLHRLRGAIPVFGPLWTWFGQYEFASLLEVLVTARLPLDEAFEAMSIALADRNVARACPYLGDAVRSGAPLGETLEASMHFDRGLGPLVSWGERHGTLQEALDVFSRVMQARIESYAAMLRRVVPVVAIAGVAAFLAGIAIVGFFSPLMNLISGLSGGGPAAPPSAFFGIF